MVSRLGFEPRTLALKARKVFLARLLLRIGRRGMEVAQPVTASRSVERTTAVIIDIGPPRF